ncbi:MAG: glycosyltransferase family 2 protein [Pseudomonadota bacterium]
MTENDSPLITIGIPTYNRADRRLSHAINDALSQTYKNIEVIVADNCSTDDTESLVGSISDPRLKYFRQKKNIGPSGNFNFCLEQATGKYFLLFHDDDSIDRDMIELCVGALTDSEEPGLLRCGSRIIDGDGNILREVENNADTSSMANYLISWLNGDTTSYFCNTLFHTERLRESGGLRSKTDMFQDIVAICRLSAKYPISGIKDVKASFRRHEDNRGSNVDIINDWIEDGEFLRDLAVKLAPENQKKALEDRLNLWLYNKMYKQLKHNPKPLARGFSYLRIAGIYSQYFLLFKSLFLPRYR